MRERALKLLVEFFVIFSSIVLALLADDWRIARDDRTSELEALEAIVQDLRLDSQALSQFHAYLGEQVEANVALLEFVERGAGEDSVLSVIAEALQIWNYRPSYPTYQSLVGSGDLSLVADASLREQITTYHEYFLPYLDKLLDGMSTRGDRVGEMLERYVRRRQVAPDMWQIVHVSSLDDLAGDVEVLNAMANSAALRSFLRTRVQQIFMTQNAELREAIEAYLSERN